MATQPNLTIARLTEFYAQLKRALPDMSLAIAGGSVRDILCNRQVKDFDIFIQVADWKIDPGEAAEEIGFAVDKLNALFFDHGVCKSSKQVSNGSRESYGNSHIEIAEVWAWTHGFNDMPCDIVFVDHEPAVAVTDGFDFGICQAWVGHYGLRTTRAFWKDYYNKTLTYMFNRHPGNEKQYKSSQEHLIRLLEKFPRWKPRDIAAP